MPRAPRKHLKRLNAPSSWVLNKLGGIFAPKPISGPHKLAESIPMILVLRNKLGLALNGKETEKITEQRLVMVDGKVRTDNRFPTGFMDVISIPKLGQHYRVMFDTKGRFIAKKIPAAEAEFKLLRIVGKDVVAQGVPVAYTNDGRVVRYPPPEAKKGDSIKMNLADGKISAVFSLKQGNLCMITGGHNIGRVGRITAIDVHDGQHDIVHVTDTAGESFCTRISNIFVIGEGTTSVISLPKGKGLRLNVVDDRKRKMKKAAKARKQKTSKTPKGEKIEEEK